MYYVSELHQRMLQVLEYTNDSINHVNFYIYIDKWKISILTWNLAFRVLPTVGGEGRQSPALASTAQHKIKTDCTAQHKKSCQKYL